MPSNPTPPTTPPPGGTPAPLPTVAPGPADLTTLQQAVANEVSVDQSAIKLINGMAAQITTLSKQPGGASQQDLTALANQLNASAKALSAAVTANTPAATH